MTSDLSDLIRYALPVAFSAGATVAFGVLANLLAERLSRYRKLEVEKLKALQETISAKVEEQRQKSTVEIKSALAGTALTPEQLEVRISEVVQASLAAVQRNTREGLDFVGQLVNGYHQQALSQARVQFWFSIAAAAVGFAYIIGAAARASDGTLGVVLNTLPGVVIDAVAFLFFKQAEQTRERATALYDRLRQDSQVASAKAMVESIQDVRIRSLVQAQIALHMSGLSPKELDLQVLKSPSEG